MITKRTSTSDPRPSFRNQPLNLTTYNYHSYATGGPMWAQVGKTSRSVLVKLSRASVWR